MNQTQKLLVVDDDEAARGWLAAFAVRLGFEVAIAETGERALDLFEAFQPDLVTLDVQLPGIDGMTTLKALRRMNAHTAVIMLAGAGSTQTIVEAIRNGACDFLRKPFEFEELETAFDKALARTRLDREVEFLRNRRGFPGKYLSLGSNPKMLLVEDVIRHVADTDITVLIRGESGTGKELVARRLYQQSSRSSCPLIKVNCAALPAELLESELFGYEKGAFTGAQRRKLGKFEVANGGTIFLDEISEMHPSLQAKLLQVLQDGQFSRLGGERDIEVDTRVVAATNRDLEASVRAGAFREDLFYRLNVVTISIPPLRERSDEIGPLGEYFLETYSCEYGKECTRLSEELQTAMLIHDWPGNVRELENLIKRIVVLGTEQPALHELAARKSRQSVTSTASRPTELQRYLSGEAESVSLKRIAREATLVAEKHLIERVLERTRWNRKEAARILQISYKALLYKMKDAGLVDSA
ncbi:MAG: sigma-54-dependent Fis family transcriptional regulator [bacterium]|nr:sigma-54-dependent Fis family transcriptional regulator [bacterium]